MTKSTSGDVESDSHRTESQTSVHSGCFAGMAGTSPPKSDDESSIPDQEDCYEQDDFLIVNHNRISGVSN